MGSTKIILAGLLALALVSSATGESHKCEYGSSSGKKDCAISLKKDDTLQIVCGNDQTTWVPDGAFATLAGKVCTRAMTDLNGTCAADDSKALNSLVSGVAITLNSGTKDFTISNKKALSEDKEIWAVCKNSDASKGYVIKVTFQKTDSNAAATWATIPAVFLGSLTTLVAMLRV